MTGSSAAAGEAAAAQKARARNRTARLRRMDLLRLGCDWYLLSTQYPSSSASTPCVMLWPMRIASLVPSATEMLFALGLGESVVGVTHECDCPSAAAELPQLTATVLPPGLSAGEIDAAVKEVVGEGRALYTLDEERLAGLAPDLIVTQAVCEVCAVSYDDVVEVARRLPTRPRVVQQDPSTLSEVLDDVVRLGEATGLAEQGRALRRELEGRLDDVRAA